MDSNRQSNQSLPIRAAIRPQSHLTVSASLGFVSLASIVLLAGAAQSGQHALTPAESGVRHSSLLAGAPALVDPLVAERRQEISEDTARLLTLAESLKAEVDKTNKDMLSLGVIRKAGEIEKLARSVKDKMRE